MKKLAGYTKTKEWIPYWLSKEKVLEHSQHELILE